MTFEIAGKLEKFTTIPAPKLYIAVYKTYPASAQYHVSCDFDKNTLISSLRRHEPYIQARIYEVDL